MKSVAMLWVPLDENSATRSTVVGGRKATNLGEGAQAWKQVVAWARKGVRYPVYAFVGEGFFVERAARELIEVLVPPAERAWNVERYDGQTVAWAAVINSLRTPGFGLAPKVVWVANATLLAGSEKHEDPATEVCEEWARGRKTKAAEALLRLAAAAGWQQDQFDHMCTEQLSEELQGNLFGRALDARELAQVALVAAYCREKGLRISGGKVGATEELATLLARGLPAEVSLVLTAQAANTRSRLWRTIQEVGVGLTLTAPRERSEALSRDAVEMVAAPIFHSHGKTISPPAFEFLVQRAGSNAACFAQEIEKLCLWVGERVRIEPSDVRAATTDLAESWVFDFTSAIGRRSLADALSKLDELLRRGEPPLRLLAVLAREMHRLLLAREILDTRLRPRAPGAIEALASKPNYADFQKQILPLVGPEELGALSGTHPFALFRRFQEALSWSLQELVQVLLDLAELDRELKSSRLDARILFERCLFRWCARPEDSAA